MLPLLVIAWLNGAAACAAMAGGGPVGVSHRADGTGRGATVDSSSHARDEAAAHAYHGAAQGPAPDVAHRHGGNAHHARHAAPAPDAAPEHPHGECAHCLASTTNGDVESDRVLCVSDGAPQTTTHLPAQWDSKPFLSPIGWAAVVTAPPRIRRDHWAPHDRAAPPPRSLNVRYCVFLN